MPTEITIRTTNLATGNDPFRGGLAGSFLVHGMLAALLIGWAWIFHTGENWGNSSANAGAIQATMIDSLPPLRPQPPAPEDNILATETPSVAPAPPTPKAVAAPQPDAIPIPAKPIKSTKLADKTAPPPPLHPQPIPPQPNKVTMGEAAASIPMSSIQNQAGTVSIATQDAAFGQRFAYYVEQIEQKVASQWYTSMLDRQAYGRRVYITFQVERDGSLSHIQIAQRSGDNTLDQTALSAVQHIDTFGPLPDAYTGNHINVTYYFDPPPHP